MTMIPGPNFGGVGDATGPGFGAVAPGPGLTVNPGGPEITTTPQPSLGPTQTPNPKIPGLSGSFQWTEGWWVTLFCLFGVATANTRFGPIMFGVLSIALIYQTSLLLQGK